MNPNNQSEDSIELLNKILCNRIPPHSKNYPSWEINITPESGRGVYATHDISVHEEIFRDHPLIIGPRFDKNQKICVICFKVVIENEDICPNGCTLPVCKSCLNSLDHEKECQQICEWIPKNPNQTSSVILRGLCAIRATLLPETDKELLIMLQGNACPNQLDEIDMLIKEFENFTEDISIKKFLFQVSAILNTNTFKTSLTADQGIETESVYVRGVYPLAAMVNHSCAPNTRYSFDKNYVMTFRAIRPIKKGEQIFTTYCKSLLGTPIRRILLKQTKQFLCDCSRCTDPSEFSTNLCALKCINEMCYGILLPSDPLNMIGQWICTECKFVHQSRKIFMMQQMISNLVATKMKNENLNDLIEFVEEKLDKIVPPTNQVSMEIKMFLIGKIGCYAEINVKEYTVDQFIVKEKFCLEVIDVLKKLKVEESVLAGKLYYELYTCRKEINKLRGGNNENDVENDKYLKKSWTILHDNIIAPPELKAIMDLATNGTHTNGV